MRFGTIFVLAGVLALPAAAVAQDDGLGESPDMNMPDMGQTEPAEPGSDVRTGMPMGQQGQQVEIFKNKDNFEVRGTVSSVDAAQNKITLQREQGLPPVELQVAQGTNITMDGKQSSLQELQPGSEVRAQFNLAQNQPVAIQLEAKPSKQQKKMDKDMEKMERDMGR